MLMGGEGGRELRFDKIVNSSEIRDVELEGGGFAFAVLLDEGIEILLSPSHCNHVRTVLYHLF
jgi:hypothetical protein